MAGAALALVVLVALPLAFLVGGSLTGDDGLTLAHFRDAVTSRLHVQALRNSLVLGAATAVLSVTVGLPLAWAVSRTDVPAKRFIHEHPDNLDRMAGIHELLIFVVRTREVVIDQLVHQAKAGIEMIIEQCVYCPIRDPLKFRVGMQRQHLTGEAQ